MRKKILEIIKTQTQNKNENQVFFKVKYKKEK